MDRMGNRRLAIMGSVAAMSLWSGLAWAQTTPIATPPQTETSLLDEIVVTAQKREQTLQDVPISVSVVTGEVLAQQSVDDFSDLSRSVPNLSVSNAALNNLVFVRGIGSGSNVGFEQSVGLFVDEVYLSRVRYMRQPFLDVERVEVLKGPQGTLFGRNTIAGALNVTSARPTSTPLFRAAIDYDPDTQGSSVTGVASGPITERLQGRIALRRADGGGYVSNSGLGSEGPDRDELAGRAYLEYRASDALSFALKVEHSDFEVTGSSIQVSEVGPALARFLAADPAFEAEVNDQRSVGGLISDRDHTRTSLASFRADYEATGFTVSAITGYARYTLDRDVDTDFSPLPFLATAVPDESYEQISQELRIASTGEGRLQWVVGGYVESNSFDTEDFTDVNGPGAGSATLAPLVASSLTRFSQEDDVQSLFGQASWALTESLTATGGLRYNHEEKSGEFSHRLTQYRDYATPLVSATARTLMRVALGRQDGSGSAVQTEERVTPSFNLDWKRDDVLLYVRYAEGFKAGGFNGAQSSPVTATTPFEFLPEEAKSFEIGSKIRLFDRAEINAAAFRTDYSDLQVSVLNGASFSVGNAAEARSQGVEVDGRWRAASWLTLTGAVAWLDAEYTDYVNAPCPARPAATPYPSCVLRGTVLVQNLTGQDLIFAPEWKGSFGAEVEFDVGESMVFGGRLSTDFTSSFYMVADNDPLDRQDGYAKVDLRLSLADADGRWEVALAGRNLTDETTSNVGNDIPAVTGAHYRSYEPPRSVTVQLRFQY